MNSFFDPSLLLRTYRDPVSLFVLLIDLSPVFAIAFFSWGVDELVIFYWIENLIIGLGVLARLLITGIVGRKAGVFFIAPFFTIHYGMFCLVHGVFLTGFFHPDFNALPLFIGLSLASEAAVLLQGFITNGAYRSTDPHVLMFSPYARVVVLHLAIFAAAASAEMLGTPIGGAIMILVLDILWGVALSVHRRRTREREAAANRLI